VDFASFLLCALKARWQGFGAVSCKFFRKDVARKIPKPQTLHPKTQSRFLQEKVNNFWRYFRKKFFWGSFLRFFSCLLQGRNLLAGVAVS
jgi:hypothetical protein